MRVRGFAVLLLLAGCGQVLGADFDGVNAGGAGGTTGKLDAGDASDTNEGGANDGASEAVADACSPVSCYSGPSGTEGVGVCKAGTSTCLDGGFGPCVGAVLPATADCVLDDQDVDCDGKTGEHVWSKRLGDPALQRLLHAVTDAAGNVYLTGYSWGTIQISTQTTLTGSLYLIKLDPKGKVAWGKSWAKGQGVALTPTPDGGIVLSALLDDTTDFGGGPVGEADVDSSALVKFASNGSHVWTHGVGATVSHLETSSDGKILFGGNVLNPPLWPTGSWPPSTTNSAIVGLLDPNGDPLWFHDFGVNVSADRFARDSQGNIWLASRIFGIVDIGADTIGESGVLTSFVAKLDSDGDPVWSRSLAPIHDFYGRPAIGIASDDTAWLATSFQGTLQIGSTVLPSAGEHDIGILHLDTNANVLDSAQFGNDKDQLVWDATVDHDDHLVVAGAFAGSMSAGPCSVSSQGEHYDAFLFKLDASAKPMWMHAFGNDKDANFEGYPDDSFNAIGIASDNSITVAGIFDGIVNFGGGPLTGWQGAAPNDLIVARYLP